MTVFEQLEEAMRLLGVQHRLSSPDQILPEEFALVTAGCLLAIARKITAKQGDA